MSFFQASQQAELDPNVFANLQTRRRQVNDSYGVGLAENQYSQSRAGLDRAKALGDLTSRFQGQRRTLSQGMGARGLANSGIWQRRVADFQQARNQGFGALNDAYSDQMARLALARQHLEASRNTQIADIDSQEAARRAEIATMLRNNMQGFV